MLAGSAQSLQSPVPPAAPGGAGPCLLPPLGLILLSDASPVENGCHFHLYFLMTDEAGQMFIHSLTPLQIAVPLSSY